MGSEKLGEEVTEVGRVTEPAAATCQAGNLADQ